MSSSKQMNMFETSADPLWGEFRSLEDKQENLRRGIFQRYSALLKLVESLQTELVDLRQEMRAHTKPDYSSMDLFRCADELG